MDSKLLEDFACLVRHKSFTEAASERHITQSALSRRIKALEKWLGVELIHRTSKQFSLTPQGRIFAPEAEVILKRLYNARETVSMLGTDNPFEITVASQNSIAQTLFLDWAKKLEQQLDNIFIRLLSEKLTDCIGLLNRGHVNYLFCYANKSLTLPIDEKRFKYLTLGKEYLIPVTAPDSDAQPMFQLPGSIDQPLPFVAYARDSIFGKAVDHLIQKKSHQCFLSRHFENPYSHTLRALVEEKMGFAWLPRATIENELKRGTLCRAGDERWDIEFDIRLYYHHAATLEQEKAVLSLSQDMADNLLN